MRYLLVILTILIANGCAPSSPRYAISISAGNDIDISNAYQFFYANNDNNWDDNNHYLINYSTWISVNPAPEGFQRENLSTRAQILSAEILDSYSISALGKHEGHGNIVEYTNGNLGHAIMFDFLTTIDGQAIRISGLICKISKESTVAVFEAFKQNLTIRKL